MLEPGTSILRLEIDAWGPLGPGDDGNGLFTGKPKPLIQAANVEVNEAVVLPLIWPAIWAQMRIYLGREILLVNIWETELLDGTLSVCNVKISFYKISFVGIALKYISSYWGVILHTLA